jgi:hypothetical protein
MKKHKWEIKLSIILFCISIVLYSIQYIIFKNAKSQYENLFNQLSFLPVYVLIVTVIIEQLLNKKEKEAIIRKLNVVIGVFFNEIGRDLLSEFSIRDINFHSIKHGFMFTANSFEKQYIENVNTLKNYRGNIQCDNTVKLIELRDLLISKKEFFMQLMSNSNLLEHESFTELLLALFHLYEELSKRNSLEKICEADYRHLVIDIERAYLLLLIEWVYYMKHLKEEYPYLFSIELRLNPLNPNASIEVK